MSGQQGLRARKKAATRAAIQAHAMRLFLAHGFEETTVAMIAAAAGVSEMTCFRHFPTKEAMVLSDPYDPLIAACVEAEPASLSPFERIRNGVLNAIDQVPAEDMRLVLERSRLVMDTPQLRARYWDQQTATRAVLVQALGRRRGGDDYRIEVIASACLAAMTTALEYWVGHPAGGEHLQDLLKRAFEVLRTETA